jgi:hypothetical protein
MAIGRFSMDDGNGKSGMVEFRDWSPGWDSMGECGESDGLMDGKMLAGCRRWWW